MYRLGNCFSDGIGCRQNKDLAFRYYLEAAENNSGAAQYVVGRSYLFGENVDLNVGKALDNLQKAAEKNIADAIYLIGTCYEQGIGFVQDFGEAIKCYQNAMDGGSRAAVKAFKKLKKRM